MYICSKHRNKPKFLVFGFTKQIKTNPKQILFRFVSVQSEIFFWFRGHPTYIFVVGSESGAKALSQLLVRQRVIFLVAGSSLVALFFYAQAGQGLGSVLSVFAKSSIR
jgi:hypothetical protein